MTASQATSIDELSWAAVELAGAVAAEQRGFMTHDQVKAARIKYAECMGRVASMQNEMPKPVVSVKTMRKSGGAADYFVSIKVGERDVTPHVFTERYKAEYHVALYDWLLNGGDEPDLMAFGPGEWPARKMPKSPLVEADELVAQLADWFNNRIPDGGLGKEHFDALVDIVTPAVDALREERRALLELIGGVALALPPDLFGFPLEAAIKKLRARSSSSVEVKPLDASRAIVDAWCERYANGMPPVTARDQLATDILAIIQPAETEGEDGKAGDRGDDAMDAAEMIAWFRANGWMVAVHNDYRQHGRLNTFWLLTHPNGRWVKGEGVSDALALYSAMGAARHD